MPGCGRADGAPTCGCRHVVGREWADVPDGRVEQDRSRRVVEPSPQKADHAASPRRGKTAGRLSVTKKWRGLESKQNCKFVSAEDNFDHALLFAIF